MGIKTSFDIKGNFDELSEFYDSDELRFFLDSSRLMLRELDLTGVKNILDVATGTGHTAIELAQALPDSHITAIDISRSMIEKAKSKKNDLLNVDFKQHDMECLETLDGKYDLVTCSFGTYFLRNTLKFFENVADKLNEYGKIVLISFADESLMPYGMLFAENFKKMGFEKEFPPSFSVLNSKWLNDLSTAEFNIIKTVEKKMQYTLKSPAEWWTIVCGTAFKSFLKDLSHQNLEAFKRFHLKNIETMINEGTNAFNVHTLITIGTKKK